MIKPNLIIVGAGGHAAACVDAIESQGNYEIEGFIGRPSEVGQTCLGYPVLGSDRDLEEFVGKVGFALVAVGGLSDPQIRIALIEKVERVGFKAPTVIAETAYLSESVSVGKGAVIMHGVVVNARAKIGDHTIINTKALIEHDSVIANYCHMSTGVIINGGVSVGRASFVGSGTIVREGVVIGENCFIGMGQSIVENIPSNTRR